MSLNIEKTSKVLIKLSAIISAFFLAIGFILIDDRFAYTKGYDFQTLVGNRGAFVLGVILGEALTVVKIIMIDRSCAKTLGMQGSMSQLYATSQYFARFLLTGALLVTAILLPQISFLGAFLGTVSLQLAGYLVPVINKRKEII